MTESADARLRRKLREQLGFLERSARSLDDGHEDEALRLATTMRVLFHSAPLSTSLLKHLAMEDTTMLSTPRTNFADWRDFLTMKIDLAAPHPVTLVAKGGLNLIEVPFRTWWESDSVTNAAGQSVSRKRLILGAANKDGGAHVDTELAES